MRLRTPGPAIGLVLALGSAAGCGGDEMFLPELGSNAHLIETAAVARLTDPDHGLEQPLVVGDLDGDGIDDALVRTNYVIPAGLNGMARAGGTVYVLYGGSGVTGAIDLASLPVLTQIGPPGAIEAPGADVAAVGDVDGDGLADFMVSIDSIQGCGGTLTIDSPPVGGVYLVYGSAARLTGSHAIMDVGVLLRDPDPCTHSNVAAGIGDIDGDGKADFAISRHTNFSGGSSEVLLFYGRGQRLSGTVDLVSTPDAVISEPGAMELDGAPGAYRAGDVDGDGFPDFIVRLPLNAQGLDARIVRGSATRLAGALALPDIGHTQLPGGDFCFFNSMDYAFALGDLDGDGADDFGLVSCQRPPNDAYGPVTHRVFYGNKAGLPAQLGAADAAATISLPDGGHYASHLAAGDLDGDGFRELILANQSLDDGNGGVHIIKGMGKRLSGALDPTAPSGITYVGQPQRIPGCTGDFCIQTERVGAGVSIGDLTGDHHPDLLIGAASDDQGIPNPGQAISSTYVVSQPVGMNP